MAGSPKALFFDVFGTLVDWRASVAREAQRLLEPMGLRLDWLAFAEAWRAQYQPAMHQVRVGREPYAKLDVLHRQMLDSIAPRFGLQDLAESDSAELTLAWHRLDAWPDVRAGLTRLRKRFLIAPLSNGNIALMVDLARRNDLQWDAILGAEIARDFKPQPAVYLAAAAAFNLAPANCMMCAAHVSDLEAAAACGLSTAYIARPLEHPGLQVKAANMTFDVAVQSVMELADRLGA